MADPTPTAAPRQRDTTYSAYAAITKSDTVNISYNSVERITAAIWVGGAGIVEAVDVNGIATQFTCVAGSVLPIQAKRVNSTNTTATLMVALF